MTQINEILDPVLLERMLSQGFVRAQTHPEFPELTILNYTEKTQFERKWNEVTRVTRGLIYNTETREVLARPFPKIHNWDEQDAPKIAWEQRLYSYSDKKDGSLGIGYVRPDGRAAIATRGSFASEQAIHATELMWSGNAHAEQHDIIDNFNSGFTPLYEIVYPENRIVLDYGDEDDTLPLGVIQIDNGMYFPHEFNEKRTFNEVLMDLSRPNAEGWVVWGTAFKAVKIKQADYVELHRIVTGLNRKSIWRAMQDDTFYELLEKVPDELYKWAVDVFEELKAERVAIYKKATALESKYSKDNPSQKEFASRVKNNAPKEWSGLIFSVHAGKNINPSIYKMIEPKGGER